MADNKIDIKSVESMPEYFADSAEVNGFGEKKLA